MGLYDTLWDDETRDYWLGVEDSEFYEDHYRWTEEQIAEYDTMLELEDQLLEHDAFEDSRKYE